LMRIWVRLKNWVDDEADAVQMYQRLAEAANMYQVGKAGLWRPPDLQLALNWQVKHKPTLVWGQRYHPAFERTMIFLEYSKKEFETEQRIKELEAKRKLKTARITAIVFGVLTGLALIALVYAFVQQGIAQENYVEAKRQETLAKTNEQKAKEQTVIANRETEKARLAELDAKEQARIAELNRKDAEEKKIRAEKAEAEAKAQKIKAEENAELARRAELLAKSNEKEANRQKDIAQRERYLSVAKAISLKSKELNDNEVEGLLAQQAYNFNTKYSGYPYDNDIYNGLFSALKSYDHPLTRSLEGHNKGAARALVTRQSNANIYSGGSDGKVIRWSLQKGTWSGEVVKEFVNPGETNSFYQIYSLDISPDGNYLVAGGLYPADRQANFVMLFNLATGGEPKKITGYISDVENINFTPDSKGFYARCNSGKSIMYSDLNTAKEVIKADERITSIDLSPDGTKLTGAGIDGNLYVWDIRNNFSSSKYQILKDQEDIMAVSFMPDGRGIVIGDEHGIVRIFDSGVVRRVLSGHTSQIEQIKFSFSGQFMATASKDGSVRLWNLKQLNEQPQVLSDHDWVWSVAFTPDDEQLMAGIHAREETVKGVNQTIRAWPTKIPTMSTQLCTLVKRNMNKEEWELYNPGLPYESTCPNYPANNK